MISAAPIDVTPLPLKEIETLREAALRAISPIRPPDSNAQLGKLLWEARRTKAGRGLPHYYLVYFLLVELLRFPKLGKSEKIAWSIPIDFDGTTYLVDHRKFGVGVFCEDPDSHQDRAKRIVSLLSRGVKIAEAFSANDEEIIVASKRKERILELIQEASNYRLCSPSDDPELQTGVTAGYRHLLVQLQRLASPVLANELASRLNGIHVEVDDIYSVYAAKAELDAVAFEIEGALEHSDGDRLLPPANLFIVDPALTTRLEALTASTYDVASLVRVCREINSSFAHNNVLAVALLMRTVLNHVPPVFGHNTFEQVVASRGKSLKESFEHLERGLRKIADFYTHKKIGAFESYPSAVQVEPYKPQFELLLHQVESQLKMHGKTIP